MRLKAVARTMNFDHWKFQGESEQEIMYIQNNQVKPEWKFIKDTEVEIIGDFIDVVQNGIWFRNVHSYRVLDNRTLIAGKILLFDFYFWHFDTLTRVKFRLWCDLWSTGL